MGEVEVEQANGEAVKPTEPSNDDVIRERIVSQLEYYFSDVNLSRDRFMQQQIREDEGWLPVDLLLKFKRLSAILGDKDKSAIIDAVRNASTMLQVNEDETKIRRTAEHPLPDGYDELRKALMTRTVYVKGFPLTDITFDQIFEYFKSFTKIDSVIMRHYLDKATKGRGFKGSAFVTFPTVEDAEAFLKLEDDKVKYNDNVLLRKWQATYIEDKRKERLEDKLKQQQRRRDNKKAGKGKDKDDTTEDGGDAEEEKSGLPLGAVIHFSGLTDKSTHRDQIRESIESNGQSVAYVDFMTGDTSGYVRLDQANSASQLLEKLTDNKLKVGNEEIEVRILEGEEETNYLDRTRKEMNKRRQNCSRFKKRRGGRGGGNFGDRGRKRRGGNMDGGPPAKIPATN